MHQYVLTQLKDPDLADITLVRIAKLQFLAGNVRDGRAAVEKVYARVPHIAGVARYYHEMRAANPVPAEVAARPLQEWHVAPWAFLHESIAREQLGQGRTRDGLVRLNAALAMSPDYVEARFRRTLVLAQLGRGREALHDWLVIEAQNHAGAVAPDGARFAGTQVVAALRANGDNALALVLEKRLAAR